MTPSCIWRGGLVDVAHAGALDLSDFLNRRMHGVFVNEVQGNPFQPDVNYRGYTASPLLGTPQGLSIFMDGVRLNQPFGEVVSWDLIPKLAIASTTLIPGSNPVFGLNTLGGALSIHTKDGTANAGTSAQATYGSHARRALEFEHGGSRADGVNWYLAGNLFGEDGWRDRSPSDVRQLFAKIGWHGGSRRSGDAPRLVARTRQPVHRRRGVRAQRRRLHAVQRARLPQPRSDGHRRRRVRRRRQRRDRRRRAVDRRLRHRQPRRTCASPGGCRSWPRSATCSTGATRPPSS